MKIVYVGLKPQKADNIAQTGLVWARGEIHEVEDEEKAKKLLEHPLIWRDAAQKYDLVPEMKTVPPQPRVHIVPENPTPYFDPHVIPVPEDVLKKILANELTVVFITAEDADAFAEWKLERETRPDTVPQETGPAPQKKAKRAA